MDVQVQEVPGRPAPPEKLLDVFQVAEWLNCSPDYVRQHANGSRQPELASISLGKLRRFRRADVEAFLELQRREPAKKKYRIV